MSNSAVGHADVNGFFNPGLSTVAEFHVIYLRVPEIHFSRESHMTKLFHKLFAVLMLTALAVLVMPLSPARSAVPSIPCDSSVDCPFGRFCSAHSPKKAGRCVSPMVTRAQFACEGSIDCPWGRYCSTKPGQSIGHCVSNPAGSSSGGPFSQAAPITLVCELSLDCPMGKHCKIPPGSDLGTCVRP
jgi:hypothetical protein